MTVYDTFINTPYPYTGALDELEYNRNQLIEKYSDSIEHQIKLKFTYISDPQLIWRDILYPLYRSRYFKVVDLAPLYDGWIYIYRLYYIGGGFKDLIIDYLYPDLIPNGFRRRFTFIGPYTLSRLLIGLDEDTLRRIIIEILDEARELSYNAIDFIEPLICYSKSEPLILRRLYTAFNYRDGIEVIIHPYHTDIYDFIGRIYDYIDGFSIDPSYTDLKSLTPIPIDKITLGVVNMMDRQLEDVNTLSSIVKELSRRIKTRYILLTNSGMLRMLPYEDALKKIRILSLVSKMLEVG